MKKKAKYVICGTVLLLMSAFTLAGCGAKDESGSDAGASGNIYNYEASNAGAVDVRVEKEAPIEKSVSEAGDADEQQTDERYSYEPAESGRSVNVQVEVEEY